MTSHTPTTGSIAPVESHVRVLIVGSGFGGLGAAIRLTQTGEHSFVVIERGNDVGGAWRDNTYPGAECDVPSNLYSFSFAPNPSWSQSFSPQPEILRYMRDCAKKFGVLPKIRFNTTVQDASWDNSASVWTVETSEGTYTADVIINGSGALSTPALPDIKGIDTFTGDIFHSAQWDHSKSLAGKRVAVIGTGASAIQIVPAIAKQVKQLDVYQRTAPWILPRMGRKYSALERAGYKYVPGLQKLSRLSTYIAREFLVTGMVGNTKLLALPERLARTHITRQVHDPELRAKVTPNWQIGCKRILLTNTWYPTLQRNNVELITDGIAEIRPNAVVTTDGTVREIDAIVVATGFHVTDGPIADHIKGADGATLGEVWRSGGQQGYKGCTVAGFPNLFLITGPNTGLGHSSMVYMIEAQLNYMLGALEEMKRSDLAAIEVRPQRQDAYNDAIQRRISTTVWNKGGCSSWYLDAKGNNSTLWPGFTASYHRMVRHFDSDAYLCTPRHGAGGSGGK